MMAFSPPPLLMYVIAKVSIGIHSTEKFTIGISKCVVGNKLYIFGMTAVYKPSAYLHT